MKRGGTIMTKLWRIHIRPTGPEGNVNVDESVKLCLNQKIIGIGWRVGKKPSSKDEYMQLGEKKYGDRGWRSAANAILNRMEIGDLVWFRDTKGIYYLGRITGEWEYRDNEENRQAGIINIRPVEYYKVGTRIAGKIINSFIRGRTVQQIHNDTALLFSKVIYNECSGYRYYQVNKRKDVDIFSLLSAEDLEDVVGLYLQLERDYVLIPSSRGRRDDTIKYEYELLNKKYVKNVLNKKNEKKNENKEIEKAFVQVKSGNIIIDPDEYKESEGTYFLFSPAGYKYTIESDTLVTLSKSTIEQFLKKYKKILPLNIRTWMNFLEEQI